MADLKLAFARHVLDDLANVDAGVSPEEAALIEQLCPRSALVAAGLFDRTGAPTPLWASARAAALERLPRELPRVEKLALVTAFLELCIVDGVIHRDEGSVLFLANSLLGLSARDFDLHLDSLTEHVGNVDLGSTVDE